MNNNQEEDRSLSFVKRWITAFNRIIRLFGNKTISRNSEFVDTILHEEELKAKSQEELDMLSEKRELLKELCEDVDSYYEKRASARKAANLDDWFDGEIRNFVQDAIPEATEEDVKEIQELLSKSMDADIEVSSRLLKSEFSTDAIDGDKDNINSSENDE